MTQPLLFWDEISKYKHELVICINLSDQVTLTCVGKMYSILYALYALTLTRFHVTCIIIDSVICNMSFL